MFALKPLGPLFNAIEPFLAILEIDGHFTGAELGAHRFRLAYLTGHLLFQQQDLLVEVLQMLALLFEHWYINYALGLLLRPLERRLSIAVL